MEDRRVLSPTFEPIPSQVDAIGTVLLEAAYTVHRALGPGLLESVYEACTAYEAEKRGLHIKTQVPVAVQYQTVRIETGLRLDLWAEKLVIVEFKAVETMLPLYEAQLLTYLKVTGCRLGYLMNFNVKLLKSGIKRLVL